MRKLDIRKEERLNNFMEIMMCELDAFFKNLITKMKSYKLKEEDQKKSNKEIQNIIEHAHRKIAQDCIRNFLSKSD